MIPFAAASIGQVHAATLSGKSPLAALYPRKMPVAVKIQFPGVRDSIKSDLGNLKWLLAASAILPKGLYLDNTIRVLERELDEECDYVREADFGNKMRNFLNGSPAFDTPRVVQELSGPMVLTTEFMSGRPLTEAIDLDQPTRDNVKGFDRSCYFGRRLIRILHRSAATFWSFASRSSSSFAQCKQILTGATFSIMIEQER